ncbi:MAG: hypothetical protein A2X94_04740 [Bdellovibrionales bacterium GWB1_55_8]|nr:MAG: hypothetical protein A2X94_04740 [Bdellovibrionales bacterium GWB1_55_8]
MFDRLHEARSTTIARDLKLNLKRIVTEGALAPEESLFALLATATSTEDRELIALARTELKKRDATQEQIQEAAESAAIMAMLNTYYRFKHMVGKDDYSTAGLRMTSLARPVLGKERFEMLAFAVSVLNGCQSCVGSHEQALREAGVSVDKIHDLARLASVVKALRALETSSDAQ